MNVVLCLLRTKHLILFRSVVFAAAFFLCSVTGAGLRAATSISQYGVTWTFDGDYTVGQFVTGDWWVVGPVTITSVSPAPASGRNGSSVNPMGKRQGYDSRGAAYTTVDNVSYPYVLQAGDSLVSSVSKGEGGEFQNYGCLQSQAVLTAVSSAQPSGAFRPGFCGTYKQYFNTSQVNYGLLPSVPAPSSVPNGASLIAWTEMPRMDHVNSWGTQRSCAQDNWTNGHGYPCYGRDYTELISDALLYTMLDTSEKTALVNNLIQIGIDNYAIFMAGGTWYGDGGHQSGRKAPIVYAGRLLNDSDMLDIGTDYPGGHFKGTGYFAENDQTYYGQVKALFGLEHNSNFCPGSSGGSKDQRDPDGLLDACGYRIVNGPSWVGQMLAMLMIGGKSAWNHDAYFDYVDRWMEGDVDGGGYANTDFIEDMWFLYRDDLPPSSGDTQAPSVPTGLAASNITDTTADLDWTASTDNVGVAGYNIYVDGANPMDVGNVTGATVTELDQSSSYTFSVSAYDAASNESAQSSGVMVTTLGSLIDEDFSSGAGNFTVISGGTWSVSSGRYVLSSPAGGATGLLGNISVHDTAIGNGYVLTTLLNITGSIEVWNDAAVVFGYQDSSNYYYVSLNESNDPNTQGVFKVVGGTPTELADISYAITSDTDYAVEIIHDGTSITVKLDGYQVASTTDATFSGGQVGYGSKNDGAQFDDLMVRAMINEDFSAGAGDFTVVSGGTWGVSSGRYVLTSPASSGTSGVLGNISVHDTNVGGDFALSVVMRITGTSSDWNDAAIVFGYQDASNYYYLSLNESNDGDTKGILKVVDGTPTELADITISVSSDTDYTIEIERSGSSIIAKVNSSQVASATDSTFTGGKVGLASYNDGAEFDDLIVE